MYLVTWSLTGSKAGGGFVLTQTCFLYVDHAVLMLTSLYLQMKSSEVCIKTRSAPASLPNKGQGTKHTTVEWAICMSVTNMNENR